MMTTYLTIKTLKMMVLIMMRVQLILLWTVEHSVVSQVVSWILVSFLKFTNIKSQVFSKVIYPKYYNFYEDSFEVYNIFLGQKLTIFEFLPKIFFILTSVTSETSWGQILSFSDLTEVSNFS